MSEGSRKSVVIESSMKDSYLRYSMSVIVSRALPDVRDGLKPVHRRVLFGMHELGMSATKPHKKSARIVGDVIGKYHPHGDQAVYDTLVRMAQEFSMRYLLAEGQGNFGSVDGDSPAAMRYTEARMSRFSEMMLHELEKETVDWALNYDESENEPTVLPAAFPNLLVNGSTGIAVGMATNMAPHNLREVVAAIRAYLDNRDITSDELGEYIKGPDFPTGGIICGRSGFRAAYATGRGRVVVRARTTIETLANGREQIIATEIPYMVNKANLLEKIADLVREKKIDGISDIRDESDRNGMRVVIELKRDALPDLVLNHLYKYTQFQTTFAINNLALVNRHPTVLPLKQLIHYYVEHRHEILVRRTQFELKKAQDRAHILEGLLIAQQNIDEVVAIIRSSKDVEEAKNRLEERFGLSVKQSDAIVQMRLRALTSLEFEKIEAEHKQQLAIIAECEEILGNEALRFKIIGDQLQEVSDKYGDERRTTVEDVLDEIDIEDLIPDDPMVVTLSETGYVKRLHIDNFRSQVRGGVGISSGQLKEEDTLRSIFVANNHSYLLAFTDLGRVYWLKVYHIPESSRTSRGRPIVNVLNLSEGETVRQLLPVPGGFEQEDQFLVMATRNGTINKVALKRFSNPRRAGINAIALEEGDELVSVLLSDQSDNMMMATRMGQAIVFPPTAFRAQSRGTRGVRGIRLGDNDAVIGMVSLEPGTQVLTLTENGYGKRTPIGEYRVTNRGGKGIRNIMVTAKTGPAVGIASVHDDWEVIVTTANGTVIRTAINAISSYGRSSQGVKVVRLRDGDTVQDMAVGRNEEEISPDSDQQQQEEGEQA